MKTYDVTHILARAQELHISLAVVNGELKVRAAKGVVTPKVLSVLSAHKQALLDYFAAQDAAEMQALLAEPQEQELCSICFAPALAEPGPEDLMYCARHHPYYRRAREEGATRELQVIGAADMIAFLQDYALRLAPGSRVALDCETTGKVFHTDKIVTVQLGTLGVASILDVRGFYNLPEGERQAWRTAFQQLFATPDVTWLGHNLKFDWLFLRQHFGVRPGRTYDTMIAEQALHEGHEDIKFGMKDLAERYGLTVSKEEQRSTVGMDRTPAWKEPFRPELLAYMAQDVEVPHQLYAAQQPLLNETDLQRVVELENAAMLAVVMMEHRGALISRERLSQLTAIKQQRQAELEQQLYPVLEPAYQQAVAQGQAEQQATWEAYQQAEQEALTSWDSYATWQAQHPAPARPKSPALFKLSSSAHLLLALRGLGIDLKDTKAETLEEVVGRHACIPQLLQWRKCQTIFSTFCSKLPQHCGEDGRIHADFHNVASGRYVTSKPNLQAIPKQRKGELEEEDPRRCVVAAPGYKLLAADLSNIELRILAEVSGDQTMLRLFAEGKDLHAETAKLMFHLPADTNTKTYLVQGKVVRDITKTISYGLAYGMGALGLAGRIGVELEIAKGLMKQYYATYQRADAYLKRSGREALKRGYAVSLSGRRRYYPLNEADRSNRSLYGKYERSAKNHAIQGTNADILKRALALLYERLPADIHIVLSVHDELVLECPDARVSEACRILQACMVEACRDFLKVVAIPTPKVLVGTHWQKD